MAHRQFPEPALVLMFSRTSQSGGTRFSFALRNPDHLAVDRAVRYPYVSYEGHNWKVVCKHGRSGNFGIELELDLQNTDPCLTCKVDFTLTILRRKEGSTPDPKRDLNNCDFTKSHHRHGEPDMIPFQTLVDQNEGYFSSISPWLEIELVMIKCVSIFEEKDIKIKPVVGGIANVATFKLSDCNLCVYFDMNVPQEQNICIHGKSILNQENQDYSLKLTFKFTVSEKVILSKEETTIHVQSETSPTFHNGIDRPIACIISEPAPESDGIVAVRIEVVSYKPATNVYLAVPTGPAVRGSQTSLVDPLGNSWKMNVQKRKSNISVNMSLSSLHICTHRNSSLDDSTAWLQWNAKLVPKRVKTTAITFNGGNDLSESFFRGKRSFLEHTMESTLEVSKVRGHSSPFCHIHGTGKNPFVVVRIEYINLQPSVLVPDGKFLVDCESTKMVLKSELGELRLKLNDAQTNFHKYLTARKKLDQQKEKIANLEIQLAAQENEGETSSGPSPPRLSLDPPTGNGSVIRSSVVSEGHERTDTPSSSIQDELEQETTRMQNTREWISKIETAESNYQPSPCHPRTPADIVSTKRLDEVAGQLGKGWQSLGRQHLGIEQSDIDRCVANNPNSLHEQIFAMLYTWKCRAGREATEGALRAKLTEARVNYGAIVLFHDLVE